MWVAYTKTGEKFTEGEHTWKDVRKKDIVKLESFFASQHIVVDIPEGMSPVMFNTGEAIMTLAGGETPVRQISQAIGYSDGEKEYYYRISLDGINKEIGTAIH